MLTDMGSIAARHDFNHLTSTFLHFRVQATVIGQALVDAKWLECITSSDQMFRDMYALYRAGEVLLLFSVALWEEESR